MQFCDLKDDGDHKFIVADHKQMKLKVYMGTSVLYVADLKSKPAAITTYCETNKKPCIPVIAVACENTLYYFKEFNPYMKFELPPVEFSDEEQKIWKNLADTDDQGLNDLTESLFNLREKGVPISCISTELISIEELEKQREYIMQKRNMPLVHQNYITCLSRINKQLDEEKAQQMLVVGTEQGQVVFLAPSGNEVKLTIQLEAVPVHLQCEG